MNSRISISTVKGKEETELMIWPSSNMEAALFKDVFVGEVAIEHIPGSNGDKIIIKPKRNEQPAASADQNSELKDQQ